MQAYPQLRPPQQQVVEGVKNLKYSNILEASFCMLIVGKPGCGKTYLIQELLTNPDFYHKKFSNILIVSPTQIGGIKYNPDIQTTSVDVAWLHEKITVIAKSNPQAQVLIVFDDVISEINKLVGSKYFLALFYNRRHLIPHGMLSILITSQKYNLCPLKIRTILTSVITFCITKNDWQCLKKELIYIDDKDAENLIAQAFGSNDKSHQFLYIRLQPYAIHINFKPIYN